MSAPSVRELREISPQSAVAATNRHYDLPPEVFEAFLDRHTKYSCGLYGDDSMTLDEAQEAKLLLIAELLHLDGGEDVLDIGSGWGSVALFLAQEYGCQVVAVTPSEVQAGHIAARARRAGVGDRVQVLRGAFQDVDLGRRRFDAVTMEEVIEHMPEQSRPLRKAYDALRRTGRLYLSASCYRSATARSEYEPRPASMHAVELYGYTAMAPVSELIAHLEDAGFSLTTLTDLTAHYDRTMRDWQDRMAANRARMDAAAPGVAAELARYFDAARAGWGYTAKLYALSATRTRMGETEVRTGLS